VHRLECNLLKLLVERLTGRPIRLFSPEALSDSRRPAEDIPQQKDPLAINFDGTAAELTQSKFAFDLDADGREEQIAFVGAGSGFLALDHNGDGTINDGSELFGPTSGDGYAELARYDSHGNGWIDAADPVYRQLRIWSRNAAGDTHLEGLDQRNVGAIYLGQIASPFMLKDADNQLLGAVRATDLYLQENGAAGTVQQIDLVA